jgi:hypothetical protein
MLIQGSVRPRPTPKRSQAHPGVHPLSPLTQTQRFQPLPAPIGAPPYHFDLQTEIPAIAELVAKRKNLVFHTVGDTGGIKHGDYQAAVAAQMKSDLLNLPEAARPLFFYHLGDVVYYNGQYADYYDQFYDPYDHYDPPIFSIPGNHDGDPADASQTSLDGWVAYFMTPTPHVDPQSHDAPRVTLAQPNVYFTLICPFATIVGLYTNVPEHGSVESVQQQWFTNELATAPEDRALIVCLHHPVYSFDDHHSGSPRLADVLQQAINDSKRVPNLVLTAHVHNFQRIERPIVAAAKTPFLVAGHGGYYHLHHLNAGNGAVDASTQAKLVASDDKRHGYVTLSVDAANITGTMTAIDHKTGKVDPKADAFSYTAKPLHLPKGATVNL